MGSILDRFWVAFGVDFGVDLGWISESILESILGLFFGSPRCLQDAPETPAQTKTPPTTSPDASKTPPRRLQNAPKTSPDATNSSPNASKTPTGTPKTPPLFPQFLKRSAALNVYRNLFFRLGVHKIMSNASKSLCFTMFFDPPEL